MSMIVDLSDKLVLDAKLESKKMHRSIPGQVEYWAMIGKLAEENPSLTYKDIVAKYIPRCEIINFEKFCR